MGFADGGFALIIVGVMEYRNSNIFGMTGVHLNALVKLESLAMKSQEII